MATAILRSQDCLRRNRFDSDMVTFSDFGSRRNDDDLNPNSTAHHSRGKRSPVAPRDNGRHHNRGRDRMVVANSPPKNLVMGQVKILKRGEELKPPSPPSPPSPQSPSPTTKRTPAVARVKGDEDLVLSTTDRLGPDPETVQKQVKVSDGIYAGSAAFFASPPPSSLPFPGFFSKKDNDVATTDLRRLLRLDLL